MKYILQFAIGAIALFVTYASVYGLGMLFHTIMIPIIVAGTALELGKYVAISYSYQQWEGLKWLEKFFLSIFISMIMAFTSVGVFSYLGQGYQTTFANQMGQTARLAELDTEIASIDKRVKEIDAEAARVPDAVVANRIKLIKQLSEEKNPLVTKLDALKAERSAKAAVSAEAAIHAGPIEYLGRVSGLGTEKAATWIIIALTACLDPFAIFMTVLLNRLIMVERRKKQAAEQPRQPPMHFVSGLSTVPNVSAAPVAEPEINVEAETETVVEPEAIAEEHIQVVPKEPEQPWWNHEELAKSLRPFEPELPVVNSEIEKAQQAAKPKPVPYHIPNPGLKHIDADGRVLDE